MWPNPQFPADLVPFTEEILNGKLHFLRSVSSNLQPSPDNFNEGQKNAKIPLEIIKSCKSFNKLTTYKSHTKIQTTSVPKKNKNKPHCKFLKFAVILHTFK